MHVTKADFGRATQKPLASVSTRLLQLLSAFGECTFVEVNISFWITEEAFQEYLACLEMLHAG